jgi:peptidoglycan hydrolase CwlO-like protein
MLNGGFGMSTHTQNGGEKITVNKKGVSVSWTMILTLVGVLGGSGGTLIASAQSEQQIHAHGEKLKAHDTQIETNNSRINSLENKIAVIEERTKNTAENVEEVKDRTEKIEDKVDDVLREVKK